LAHQPGCSYEIELRDGVKTVFGERKPAGKRSQRQVGIRLNKRVGVNSTPRRRSIPTKVIRLSIPASAVNRSLFSQSTMKISPNQFTIAAILAASLSALAITGCNKQDRTKASTAVQDAYADTKNAMSNAWDDVKSYSYEKRDDFTKHAKAVSSKLDSEMSQLHAN
jgi:hypothetical protein